MTPLDQKIARAREIQKLYEATLADYEALHTFREEHMAKLAKNMKKLTDYYTKDWLADREAIIEEAKPYPVELDVLGEDPIWYLIEDYALEMEEWGKLADKAEKK